MRVTTCSFCDAPLDPNHRFAESRKFCDRACFRQSVAIHATCQACGRPFMAERRRIKSCSKKCADALKTGPRSPTWRGGEWGRGDGAVFVWQPDPILRPSGRARAVRKSRVVAAEAIGRPLHPWEMVLHISMEPDDNRPENLFICATRSEMTFRLKGGTPWPTSSNLTTYAAHENAMQELADHAQALDMGYGSR